MTAQSASCSALLQIGAGAERHFVTTMKAVNEPQIIRTAAGEELVVLSRAEYDALIAAANEAAEDQECKRLTAAKPPDIHSAGLLLDLPPPVAGDYLDGDKE